jgi:oxaloacetate decarboxylase beta subunit
MEVEIEYPTVSKKAKFIFTVCACLLLCLLLPVAAPLILSFFLGIAIKEAEIEPFQKLLESTLTYTATLFLGLLLGTLCEAQTILDPKVAIILILGIGALAISAVGALLGGWFIWFISKGRYNPAIGIAGVSCLPTTAKIAQKEVNHENPYAIILPLAMGAGVSGLIVSAIATGIFISTLFLLN